MSSEHALNADAGPRAGSVVIRTELPVPAIIDAEEQFGRGRKIHAAEYKAGLSTCKLSKPRNGDSRPERALLLKNFELHTLKGDDHIFIIQNKTNKILAFS